MADVQDVEVLDEPETEIERRRAQVLALHIRGLSQTAIAAALSAQGTKVEQYTISRDMAWIRKHWKTRFGAPPELDPTEEIGSAIAVFSEIEAKAWRSLGSLKADQARDQNMFMKNVLLARQMRINLLQDLGFIDRKIGEMSFTFKADAVRRALREEGMLTDIGRVPRALIEGEVHHDHEGHAHVQVDEEDEVDRWLRMVESDV